MQQITIGTKNQVVIPLEVRKKILGLKPGKKISIYVLDQDTIALKVANQSWLDRSYGTMRQAGQRVSSLSQIEKMRNEWDEE